MLPWTNSKENSLKYCIRIVNLLVSETLDWVLVWTSPLSLQRLGVSGTGPAGKSDGPPTDLSVHSRQLSVLWRTGAQVITRGRFIRGEDWLASSYTVPVTCTIDQFSIGKINTISLVLYIYNFNLPWRERERERVT